MMKRRRRGRPLDGWLILDKPQGPTSTDMVNKLKRLFDAEKAGHGGTLDPLATGLLPIAFGAATKTAIKVAGERAYDMAREGRAPVLEARPAQVDRFVLIDRPDADTAVFEVESGKGVYMRSLARDVAQACGSLGHITVLRRLRVGPFTEEMAISLDKLDKGEDTPPISPALLLPVATALADIPALALTDSEAVSLQHGQALSLVDLMGRIPEGANPAGGLARAMVGGRVIGLCRLEEGWMKPERLL